MTTSDTTEAERRHEGPSYWAGTSLADLIACAAEFVPDPDDGYAEGIHARMVVEIRRRQRCIMEAENDRD